ncbi:nitrite reductase (NADH) large subunit [Keratinibaculum paraultunense]|uniref:Nitrite reductase (NADH) large subunit n=1 Tax=Keratinibaculum paraultunense TaxID=1278232 RepID=A0A4R3KXC7_9FIRM|nr:FAD-dependent oxidoreductase [Keratinibaculum paraultunense]QQY78867.1 NAD(P)/FAD-dependent oxidoreductase [Keratinibaculum paraultunense]TCS90479.1 nitrite reductase (NADH) large subunit [Keratinibaculum paraultunense]
MDNVKYLIIGNGIAGLSAAREIRKIDDKGSMMMITNEPYLTYYRLKLTEYLSKDFKDEELLVNSEDWYKEKNIKVLLNMIVESLDVDKNEVKLDDGSTIKYEKLLLAMGSRPFIPPIPGKFKQGVLALRTLEDLKYIKSYFDECKDIVIIGGGPLSLEAAWHLNILGKNISLVVRSSYLMNKQLDEEISKKLEEKLIENGINIYLNSNTEEILGKAKADGIKLDNGEHIKADGVLFSTGIVPNIDIVRDTPIKFNRGIIVDNKFKTNIDNIYAAGDVAEVDGRIIGLWTSSNEQGKVAGSNMAGKIVEHTEAKPFTTLRLGDDINIFSMGNVDEYDKVYEHKEDNGNIHHKIFTTDGKITGGILFGDIKDMGKLRKAIIENMDIDSYLE